MINLIAKFNTENCMQYLGRLFFKIMIIHIISFGYYLRLPTIANYVQYMWYCQIQLGRGGLLLYESFSFALQLS